MRLIHQLQLLESALAADDAVAVFDLLRALDDELGEGIAVAIARRLLDERTAGRREAAAEAVEQLARCA